MTTSATERQHNLDIIQKLLFMLEPHRYKVLYGGRGGVKSWTVARLLLHLGTKAPLRILCTREVQESIQESVHHLLEEQIELMGLHDFYAVLSNEIRGRNGTEFIFKGLSELTIESIKSYEAVDIAWCEEANKITARSWSILTPTIRKKGSEIWITFNPELDTDETYVRYVLHPPESAVVCELSYRDNPWLAQTELDAERRHDEQTKPREEYEWIWEGKCRSTVSGAIYAHEVGAILKRNRYTLLPYDPRLKVHTVWDMGWNDAMAIGLVQRGLAECRIIGYYEGSFIKVDEWASILNRLPYNWGWDWLPFDAYCGSRQTGQTDAQILRACGRRVRPEGASVPKVEPEAGIRLARQLLGKTYIAKEPDAVRHQLADGRAYYANTGRLVECLKRYKRVVPKRTGEPMKPDHDEYSHGADMVRHLACVVDQLTNETDTKPIRLPEPRVYDRGVGALG